MPKCPQMLKSALQLSKFMVLCIPRWGISAVGSAPQWHCGGQEFESLMLHHQRPIRTPSMIIDGVRIEAPMPHHQQQLILAARLIIKAGRCVWAKTLFHNYFKLSVIYIILAETKKLL